MMLGRGLWAVALTVLSAAPTSAANNLPSHEAVYEILLVQASSAGGPRAAVGTMESRFTETCDGWETKTHATMNVHFANDTHYQNERFFQSMEAKNGRNYTFAVQTVKNGMIEENFKGRANMGRRGGEARYELHPVYGEEDAAIRMVTVQLPEGTLFPAARTLALLTSAERGSTLHNTVLLDGSSSVGPRRMSVAIGARSTAVPPVAANIDASLLSQPSWSISTAMFNLFERGDTPTSEVFQQYYGSGISESFEQTFSDFRLAAHLTHLKRLDPPKCK